MYEVAEAAIESGSAWAIRQRRHPSGGIRQLFVRNAGNGGAGPDSEFAVPLLR